MVTSIRGLPLGVRDGLQALWDSQGLDIAEPGAEFQVTDVAGNPKLPIRRLVAAGCSTDHCLVYYERGGIAHTWLVALFHWTPAETRFEWGGAAPAGSRPSTTFGTPSCPARSRVRTGSGRDPGRRVCERQATATETSTSADGPGWLRKNGRKLSSTR